MFSIAFLSLLLIHHTTSDILVLSEGIFVEAEFRDMPSTFGNGLPYDGLQGMISYAEPANGCTPIKKPPNFQNRTGKWIAIIARYNCSFEAKVRMAQQANYDAVIVHNVNSDALEAMSAKNSTGIHIPSVFVSEQTGIILKEAYADKKEYYVIINSEIPFNINTHLILPFAIVVGICFLVMVVFIIAKCIRDRRRRRRDRLSSSALNKIPIHKFQKLDPYETCAICLEDYVEGEKLRILPCSHAYHSKCIDPWLTENRRVCPVCKRKVFVNDEEAYSDSDSESDLFSDTTPLLQAAPRTTTQGGTFVTNFIPITASGQHSINGEQTDSNNPFYTADDSSTSNEVVA